MAKHKQDTYTVNFRIAVETSMEVVANSVEEALQKGTTYKVIDCIDILGSHNDSTIEVSGVFAPYKEYK